MVSVVSAVERPRLTRPAKAGAVAIAIMNCSRSAIYAASSMAPAGSAVGRPTLARAAAAMEGTDAFGQLDGSAKYRANCSKLRTVQVAPPSRASKNEPRLATIVATLASDLPPCSAVAAEYARATVSSACS